MPIAPAEPTDITVAFANKRRTALKTVTRPALVVIPDPNTWNDYGLQLFADLLILTAQVERELPISLMFEESERTYPFLVSELAKRGPVIPAAEIGTAFISLQREAGNYATLVDILGFDAAIQGLRGLNDAVLARLEDDGDVLRLFDTLSFHIGMMRNASQYVALRRGGQHLRRHPVPPVEDAAVSFSVIANLPSSEKPCALLLDFRPDEIFQDRCCVLIGRNGVGKTQLIKALVEGLATEGPKPGAGGASSAALRPRPEIRRVMIFSSVPSDPYLRSIPPWTGLDYEYHPLVADDLPLGRAFLTAILDCLRDDGSAFGPSSRRDSREELLAESMAKLGLWNSLHVPLKEKRVSEFHHVRRADGVPYLTLRMGLSEYRKSILFHAIDWTRPAAIFDSHDRLRHLSSGELAMANFVTQAVASIENGSLLLFDEPETHLHPNYVSEFMDSLQDLLQRTRSIAVIATHSSHVVREVPRQRVNILQLRSEVDPDDADGDREPIPVVDVVRPRMQTFGSNVDDISRFVFGDGIISHRYQRVLREWVGEVGRDIGIDEVLNRFGEKLNSETLSFIAAAIRDRRGG